MPLARPALGEQATLRFAVADELFEAIEVDPLVLAVRVELPLAGEAARGDRDHLAREIVEADAAKLRLEPRMMKYIGTSSAYST